MRLPVALEPPTQRSPRAPRESPPPRVSPSGSLTAAPAHVPARAGGTSARSRPLVPSAYAKRPPQKLPALTRRGERPSASPGMGEAPQADGVRGARCGARGAVRGADRAWSGARGGARTGRGAGRVLHRTLRAHCFLLHRVRSDRRVKPALDFFYHRLLSRLLK